MVATLRVQLDDLTICFFINLQYDQIDKRAVNLIVTRYIGREFLCGF